MTSLHARPDQAGAAATARVVLIGPPSSLRAAVARELRGSAALLGCLDSPARLSQALSAVNGSAGFSGAAVVFATVPRLPGVASGLRHRFRGAALAAAFADAVTAARQHGAARIVVLSTAFRYDDDRGRALDAAAPTLTAAETGPAAAAEAAAGLFSRLGGDAVVLRLGWTCGPGEDLTRRVLSAARRGWRLIDADPAAWVPMVAEADAARAVRPALTVPPGTYHVTDGHPVTQGVLDILLASAAGQALHSLDDPRWGHEGILFGRSRKVTDTTFDALAGWHPRVTSAADDLAAMVPSRPARRPPAARRSAALGHLGGHGLLR